MHRNLASGSITLFCGVLILVAGVLGFAKFTLNEPGPLREPIFFAIDRGESLSSVSRRLHEADVVGNEVAFLAGAFVTGKNQDLKFGSYEFPAGASMHQVLETITTSAATRHRFRVSFLVSKDGGSYQLQERIAASDATIELARYSHGEDIPAIYDELVADSISTTCRIIVPEGLTSWQIVESLKNVTFLTGELSEIPAEGSLAPNTYEVSPGSQREAVLTTMQDAQAEILAAEWSMRAEGLHLETAEQALILASIVERETALASERHIVSSVFHNRLSKNMALQSDPTVIYGLTEGQGELGRGIRQSELRKKTPWNTYVKKGLPQTPIANPGRPAIHAALHPADTDYIFFVADGTGGHKFAVSFEDHLENVRAWRRIERQAASGN